MNHITRARRSHRIARGKLHQHRINPYPTTFWEWLPIAVLIGVILFAVLRFSLRVI